MDVAAKPLLVGTCQITPTKTTFFLHGKKVELTIDGEATYLVAELCDGTRDIPAVLAALPYGWNPDEFSELLAHLEDHGVLVSSTEYMAALWPAVQNPTRFTTGITDAQIAAFVEEAALRHQSQPADVSYKVPGGSPLWLLLQTRESIRAFGAKALPHDHLVRLLWASYGDVGGGRRTVPSGGALYPLHLALCLLQPIGDLSPGIYHVSSTEGRVGLRLVSSDTHRFIRAYADPLMLELHKPTGVLVYAGAFAESSKKYGNRAVLYTVLEAGHAAQNTHLMARELGLGTVEIGGFLDQALGKACELPPDYTPLTTVFFGYAERVPEVEQDPYVEFNWAVPASRLYEAPFAMAFARLKDGPNPDWSCGRSTSPALARIKAVSEAREWASCAYYEGRLIRTPISELPEAIQPGEMVAYHEVQYAQDTFRFGMFDRTLEYEWVGARDELSGSEHYVLADCVFYPYEPSTPLYTHANSSGVAAHPDREQALKNGVLELIERDAFMGAHLNRLTLPTITVESVPEDIQKRIRALNGAGFEVWIKDATIDLAPALLVFAQSEEHAYTTCSGSAGFDLEDVLDHALMEVESSVLYKLTTGEESDIAPAAVLTPADHDRLYGQRRYYQSADYLKDGVARRLAEAGKGASVSGDWDSLLQALRKRGNKLLTVENHLPERFGGNGGRTILRSIIPGLIPVSFGYGEEPWGVPRIRAVAERAGVMFKGPGLKPSFPHPYT